LIVDQTPIAHHPPAAVEPVTPAPPALVAEKHTPPAPQVQPAPIEHPVPAPAAQAPGVLQEFVSDLETSIGDNFIAGAVPHQAKPTVEPVPEKVSKPANQPELEPIGNSAPTT